VKILKLKNVRLKLLIILSTILLANCSIKKHPEFLTVKNIEVVNLSSKELTVKADAHFLNPNIIGGELKTDKLEVLINDKKVATIKTENFKVPAKKEFKVPLETKIHTDSIVDSKNIGKLLSSIIKNELKIKYQGIITYKILGFSHNYTIDKTDFLKIKL